MTGGEVAEPMVIDYLKYPVVLDSLNGLGRARVNIGDDVVGKTPIVEYASVHTVPVLNGQNFRVVLSHKLQSIPQAVVLVYRHNWLARNVVLHLGNKVR